MKKKPLSIKALIFCTAFQAISGLSGGAALLLDPSGQLLNLPEYWLDGTPFTDYFVPGLILFSILGVFPIIVLTSLLREKDYSAKLSFLLGLTLIIWIITEIIIIGYKPDPPLQLIYGLLGLVIFVLASRKAVKKHYIK